MAAQLLQWITIGHCCDDAEDRFRRSQQKIQSLRVPLPTVESVGAVLSGNNVEVLPSMRSAKFGIFRRAGANSSSSQDIRRTDYDRDLPQHGKYPIIDF